MADGSAERLNSVGSIVPRSKHLELARIFVVGADEKRTSVNLVQSKVSGSLPPDEGYHIADIVVQDMSTLLFHIHEVR